MTAPTFHFSFTETSRDAADAYDTLRTARFRMRGWARALMACLGLFFLAGVVFALTNGRISPPWPLLCVWLAIGLGLSWRFLLEPTLVRRGFRHVPDHAVDIECSDAGLTARVGSGEPEQRYWGELVGMIPGQKGLGLGFRGGTLSWLPQRVFAAATDRDAFETFVRSKLPAGPQDTRR